MKTTELASMTSAVPLQRDAQAAGDASLWLPVLAMLALCVAAAAYLAWQRGVGALLRGGADNRRAPRALLARVSSQALTPQASVHILRWQGEELLVACTAQQVTLLARKPMPAGDAS